MGKRPWAGPVVRPRSECPECRAGKHDNCDGGAWDVDTDEAAVCECWEHDHEESVDDD